MKTLKIVFILSFFVLKVFASNCLDEVKNLSPTQVEIESSIDKIEEFRIIREFASQRGFRVFIFGGAAATLAHFVLSEVRARSAPTDIRPRWFVYNFDHIFRSTQDIDIAIDGTPAQGTELEAFLKERFPYVLSGTSRSVWDLWLLKLPFKNRPRLLENNDLLHQHSDSHSNGVIELTTPPSGENIIRDLRGWDSKSTPFESALNQNKIGYFWSSLHQSTSKALQGENPPIFSAIRALISVNRYGLLLDETSKSQIQKIIDNWDPKLVRQGTYAEHWILTNSPKLLLHSKNLEAAWDLLNEMGLRSKLAEIGPREKPIDLFYLMNRSPLRSYPIGLGSGKTASELGIDIVSHQLGRNDSNPLPRFEAISFGGGKYPNAFISRVNTPFESADYGNGFYVAAGSTGIPNWNFGNYTIRFRLDPNAREGHDFTFHPISKNRMRGKNQEGDQLVIKNKRALEIVEADTTGLEDPVIYFSLLEKNPDLLKTDQPLARKVRRIWMRERQTLSEASLNQLRDLVESHLAHPLWNINFLKEWLSSPYIHLIPEIGRKIREKIDSRISSYLQWDSQRDGGKIDNFRKSLVLDVWYEDPLALRKILKLLIHEEREKHFLAKYVFAMPITESMEDLVLELLKKSENRSSLCVGESPMELLPIHALTKPHAARWTKSIRAMVESKDPIVVNHLIHAFENAPCSAEWIHELTEIVSTASDSNNYGIPLQSEVKKLLKMPKFQSDEFNILRRAIEIDVLSERKKFLSATGNSIF